MTQTPNLKSFALLLLGTTLLLGGSFCQAAQNNKKTTTPAPAKPAPAPAPKPAAAPPRPTAGTTTSGPRTNTTTTSGPRTSGPTASGGGARPGPTANGGGAHPGPTANGSGARPGVTNTGVHPNSSTNRVGPTRLPAEHVGNKTIQRDVHGKVRDIHDAGRGIDVHRGLAGGRRVVVERPGGVRIVAERGRPGFVQRPFAFRGHDFSHRTYVYHGRVYDRFYRSYSYHGRMIDVYAPRRYYGAGFYGWAYNPWYHPVAYAWGWGPSPWFGYYGFFFTPYPVYASPALWLTDYMISSDLQAEYQGNTDAGTMPPQQVADGAPALSPEVKQAISQEVQSQIALENSEAQQNAQGQDPDPGSSGIARMLTDGHSHVFVAGSSLDVVDASGAECAISPGDALQFNPPADPSAPAINLVVLASKGGQECAQADSVTVALGDLQEMQNHMRETIDDGLAKLQSQQGHGGLPAAPPSAQTAPVNSGFATTAPPPDPTAASDISQQDQQASVAENEAAGGPKQ